MAWSLFAFGAVYPWAAPPLLVLTALAAATARARPRAHLVDAALLALPIGMALQLVPLPPALRHALAPSADEFREAVRLIAPVDAWAPLTLDPSGTWVRLALVVAAVALVFATRARAQHDGRSIARWLGWMALVAAIAGIGRSMLFPSGRIYGFWNPLEIGASPFGVIINRNHYAAWAVVAVALTAGHLFAHAARVGAAVSPTRRHAALIADGRILWMAFAVAVVAASIVFSASRSGFIGLLVAMAVLMALAWRRMAGRGLAAGALLVLTCSAAAAMWASPERLMDRIGDTTLMPGFRAEIWRESSALAARYPLTGVGAGAYPAAMGYYQTRRDVFFNHAHNQYLEMAVEGGVLLSVPLLLVIAGAATAAGRGLASDAGSYFWLRAGAVAGLAGLAVLSLWESPFRTPATLMVAAVAAGLAVAPPQSRQ